MIAPSHFHLRTFEACGRHRSFKRAAEELGITASAVSHQIRAMEEQLGVSLFLRGNRNVSFTQIGQEYWEAVHGTFESLRHETQRIFGEGQGVLRVLCSRSFLRNRLLHRLPEFLAQHPDVRIDLPTFGSRDSAKLEASTAAAWIRIGHGRWPGRKSVKIMDVELFPMCSPGYLASHGPLERPEDLARHRLILTTGRHSEWDAWARHFGLRHPVSLNVLELEGEGLDYQSAMAGLGIALARRGFCEAEFADGRLVPALDASCWPGDAYYLSFTPAFARDRRLIALRDWLEGWAI